MAKNEVINFENALSEVLFKEFVANANYKKILQEICLTLKEKILNPLKMDAKKNNYAYSSFTPFVAKGLKKLAEMHSWHERQYGAIFPHITNYEEILFEPANLQNFLTVLENRLTDVSKLNTIEEMAQLIKLIVDLGFSYAEFFPDDFHGPLYTKIKNMLWPTQEEFDIRLSRSELGQPDQLVAGQTYGIGTEAGDLVPKVNASIDARIAGKSVFGSVSIKDRLQILLKTIDNKLKDPSQLLTLKKYLLLKEELEYLNQTCPDNKTFLHEIAVKLQTEKSNFGAALIDKFEYYKLPLDPDKRIIFNLDLHAKKIKTHFEKLMQGLPLIASVSGSTARVLITLMDIGSFTNPNLSFKLEEAQIVANAIMAFFVRAGHHSFAEVAESYNRLLDYMAWSSRENIDEGKGPLLSDVDMTMPVERQLPYYIIGNYKSFLHRDCQDRILCAADAQTRNLRYRVS